MDQVPRSAWKPECISALIERAIARSLRSSGQPAPPASSLAYSQMAIESQMRRSPSSSTGTRPVGDQRPISARNCGVSSGSRTSWNGRPR
jgi:hypothetical protein